MYNKTSTNVVKSLKQDIKSGIVIFLIIVSLWAITVFAANWYDSFTATSWEALTTTKWNLLVKATVPTWAIMAFNSDTGCPDWWILANGTNPTNKVGWWSNTLDLRWKFLRWIDSSWTFDSVRDLGNYQEDDFKSHAHSMSPLDLWAVAYWWWWSKWPYNRSWWPAEAAPNTTSTWWTETRPKNVAVLYCVKQ